MLINHTLEKLRAMKLFGMADALQHQLDQPNISELSFEERLGLLVDMEATKRENKRLQMLLRNAHFKFPSACIEDIIWSQKRGLDKSQMLSLANCDWIRARENIGMVGSCGTGKSYLVCALGNAAARQSMSVQYTRAPRLFEELKLAHADGTIARKRAKLAKTDLLIIDDFGIDQLGRAERTDLLEIIEDRYANHSTIIAGQLPIDRWHAHINDATIADAVLDRLLHNAHKILLSGESMRKTKGGPKISKLILNGNEKNL
jgi:DNA replication protein DnaC